MTSTARRRGSVLAALLTAFAFALSLIAAAPAQAADLPYSQILNREPVFYSSVCLEIDNARGWDGAAAAVEWCSQQSMNENWRFVDQGDGWYQVRVQHTDKCLSVRGGSYTDGAQIEQSACVPGRTSQQWTMIPTSFGYFELVARHSGKCLDKSFWNVVQWNCHGGLWQQWLRV
jgi:hypothetical protein